MAHTLFYCVLSAYAGFLMGVLVMGLLSRAARN